MNPASDLEQVRAMINKLLPENTDQNTNKIKDQNTDQNADQNSDQNPDESADQLPSLPEWCFVDCKYSLIVNTMALILLKKSQLHFFYRK